VRPTTRRATEVAGVLMRHGLGSIASLVDVRRLVPSAHTPTATQPHGGGVHLRQALEDLGPTFVKLGQVLSTRPDLVPPDYEAELTLLQDAAPPVPTQAIVTAIEAVLRRPLDELFERFETVPLAAASIGQVHAATVANGREVVVKVRRPGVVDQIAVDLQLLHRLARAAARRSAVARRYDVVGLAGEFSTTLQTELDYLAEGRNAEHLAGEFDQDPRVHIPAVDWERTGDGVITEERIHGVKVDDVDALDAISVDRAEIAHTFANAYLAMVFDHGVFHADPHPGNVFVESHGGIAFVDFGMVGAVDADTRRGLGVILLALVAGDATKMADGLLRLGIACEDVDRLALEHDLTQFLERYSGLALEALHLSALLRDLMAVVRAHRLRLPSDLALLLKTVMMCEGVAANLHPGFELVPLLLPYAARLTSDAADESEAS
jgi:ubiquinone biosynthesis protein